MTETSSYEAYDYQDYWSSRQYEDQAERLILRKLLTEIKSKNTVLDLGGGFGRLIAEYAPIFKKCFLIDPSEKLLGEAKQLCSVYHNVITKAGNLEKTGLVANSIDVVLTIRTLHHLKNLESAIWEIRRVLTTNGYLILEFANKIRFTNTIKALFKFDLAYFSSHQRQQLPFLSYHPNQIKTLLLKNKFKIHKLYSVSNFRNSYLKKILTVKQLLGLEKIFISLEAYLPFLRYFGPSIFVLAKKK